MYQHEISPHRLSKPVDRECLERWRTAQALMNVAEDLVASNKRIIIQYGRVHEADPLMAL